MKLFLLPVYVVILFIASAVTVNAITFEYMGVCPPALARAEFQKDQLFSLLEGEQGHLGTEIRDIVLSVECPLLGLKSASLELIRPPPVTTRNPARDFIFFRFSRLVCWLAPGDRRERWKGCLAGCIVW